MSRNNPNAGKSRSAVEPENTQDDQVTQPESATEQAEKPTKKKAIQFEVNGKEAIGMVAAKVIKLRKEFLHKQDARGNELFDLIEEKELKQVKILREHLAIHESQEANTLLRYKEV